MKIMSEKTGKEYPTVELCLAAEKEYDDKLAKEKEEKEAKEQALVAKKEAALAERKEAASKARQIPRVKHDKKTAILEVKEISKALSQIDIKSRIIKNIQENICLQNLRDYLLPLLMNNQVSIA